MDNVKVSVILPSLNVVSYIEECLESVIKQTLKEIEIICVDAGSTDGTLEILSLYQKKDSRVKVIHSDKKSYGYQMNLGISFASGEYIGIVETDDYVEEKMCENLYELACENQLDFVKADFYRFTTEDNGVDKVCNHLCQNKDYYNRVIDISREKECFLFPMNTWCGIYKRRFLLENRIWHNETPGASYQDNGFWFQTFMYAKRAYFVDKPYYMNRRDNPNSSVYNREKVYCICDEYKYIWDIMCQSDEYRKRFTDIFVYACYRAFKANLYRIASIYQEEFLNVFSEFFQQRFEKDGVDVKWLAANDQTILNEIIQSPQRYWSNVMRQQEKIYSDLLSNEKIIIYGAGMVGKKVYQEICLRGYREKIIAFAVTSLEENYKEFDGIGIIEINNLLEYKEVAILIATTFRYQKEIQVNLQNLGFKKIFLMPEE